jgi:dihydrofolate reductase
MGHYVIMGRKTYESLGRPLPGRTLVVVTRQPDYDAGEAQVAANLDESLRFAAGDPEPFIIGGADIFRLALPRVDRIYQTVVHARPEGDTFFPSWDESQWRVLEQEDHGADEKNEADYTFRILERRR